jgi:hypothetical protein
MNRAQNTTLTVANAAKVADYLGSLFGPDEAPQAALAAMLAGVAVIYSSATDKSGPKAVAEKCFNLAILWTENDRAAKAKDNPPAA